MIGAIDIYDEFTLVDVPAEYKQQVLGAMAGARLRNLPVSIRVARPGMDDGERTPAAEEAGARRSPRTPAAKRTAQHTRPTKPGAPRGGKAAHGQAPAAAAQIQAAALAARQLFFGENMDLREASDRRGFSLRPRLLCRRRQLFSH